MGVQKEKVFYSDELAIEICTAIATQSKGIKKLCKENPHWPNPWTIMFWRMENEKFRELYLVAKQNQIEVLVDEILDISDDTTNDYATNENGTLTANKEYINRSRLRVDTRKWLAGKLAPKIYGDRVQYTASVGIKQEDLLKELE